MHNGIFSCIKLDSLQGQVNREDYSWTASTYWQLVASKKLVCMYSFHTGLVVYRNVRRVNRTKGNMLIFSHIMPFSISGSFSSLCTQGSIFCLISLRIMLIKSSCMELQFPHYTYIIQHTQNNTLRASTTKTKNLQLYVICHREVQKFTLFSSSWWDLLAWGLEECWGVMAWRMMSRCMNYPLQCYYQFQCPRLPFLWINHVTNVWTCFCTLFRKAFWPHYAPNYAPVMYAGLKVKEKLLVQSFVAYMS